MIELFAVLAFLTGIALLGIFLLLRPIAVLQLVYRWPRFAFRRMLPERYVSPSVRAMLRLIGEDPLEYQRRFPGQVFIMRVTGVIALFIACVGVLLELAIFAGAD